MEGEKYIFNEKITCNYCNTLNTFFHIVSSWEKYKTKRIQLKLPMIGDKLDVYKILETSDLCMAKKFIAYMEHILYDYKNM